MRREEGSAGNFSRLAKYFSGCCPPFLRSGGLLVGGQQKCRRAHLGAASLRQMTRAAETRCANVDRLNLSRSQQKIACEIARARFFSARGARAQHDNAFVYRQWRRVAI